MGSKKRWKEKEQQGGRQADEWEEDERFSFLLVKLNKMKPPRIFYLSSDKNNEPSFIF